MRVAILFCAGALATLSCTRPEEELGVGLQDEDNLLSVLGVDTFTLRAWTLPEERLRSDNFNPGLVGAYVDPIFGFLKAEHVTELRLSTSNPVFAAPGSSRQDLVVDSLVLHLSYITNLTTGGNTAVYGNKGPQFFRVYEVTDSLSIDSSYFHTRPVSFIDEDLVLPGRNLVRPVTDDTTFIGGALALPELRLPLRTEIAERILDFNDSQGLTIAQFISLVKGLYITVDETQFNPFTTGIVYFDTHTQLSRMSMYYRNTALNDTARYDFLIRNNSGKYARFQHVRDQAHPTLVDQIVNDNPASGAQDLYVQAGAGTKLRIDLPHIETLRGLQGEAISQAVLTLPVRQKSVGVFNPPQRLFIFALDDEGNAFLIDDQLDAGSGAFVGGAYDPQKGHYQFTISRYLQQVINGTRPFNGLEIVSERAAFSANRAVLNGPEYPDPVATEKNMKLQIIFTKY